MYGMIHQAARDMTIARIGRAEWERLAAENGLRDELFIGMGCYDDSESLALIGLIADRLGLAIDDALHGFGEFWVDFAGASAYGRLLTMAGNNLESFLDNLDRMHATIKSNMPQARMPSFQVLSSDPAVVRLLYVSDRPGLEPFVAGILASVARHFGERVKISYRRSAKGAEFRLARIPASTHA